MKHVYTLLWLALISHVASATEFHVSTKGNDNNDGSFSKPFKTISAAARVAQPGDVLTVHGGTYRERVTPPRGGESDARRIVYRAAKGEVVEIKGSEVVKNWVKVQDDVWKVTLPNSFFGTFNPYSDLIRGDWFDRRGRDHHTGAVYLNGDWLIEAAKLEDVLMPAGTGPAWLTQGGNQYLLNAPLWYAGVDALNTTLWAQFPGVNPNEQLVEINVRRTVFYPDQPGRNFITVRGFTLRHAATPWAQPTAEQIGLIGTHWSKGWIIENNVISHSVCSGIALGKYGDPYDNTSADTAEGYVKTIERAHAHAIPWTKEAIGHHVVRNNTISHCEQAGVVGSLGAAFSTVTGNTIHDIHVRRLFSGAEMAGIKFHAAIDTTIRGNHIYRTCRGLWLDWMAQGTRISANLFHDNMSEDLFVEVNHGPFLVDNNLFLSTVSLLDMSEGGAYAHNLFAGQITNRPEPSRATPYHPAHSTTVAGLVNIRGGDDRFYNNVFVGRGETPTGEGKGDLKELRWISSFGLWGYDGRELPLHTGGNVYYRGAEPCTGEAGHTVLAGTDPKVELVQQGGRFTLQISLGSELKQARTVFVTTEILGKARIPGLPYENADGSLLKVDADYFGRKRSTAKPSPGPFENPGEGDLRLKVFLVPDSKRPAPITRIDKKGHPPRGDAPAVSTADRPWQQAGPEDMQWWREARIGMFVHWGPVSLKGTEIGWSRGDQVPTEVYDQLYREFNPTGFNADEWVSVAKAAGMKYLVFTTKHHDGFCEWDTEFTDYNIMNTIYLHLFDPNPPRLTLPPIARTIVGSTVLTGGTVEVGQTPDGITLTLPQAGLQDISTIVELRLNGPAADIPPVEVPSPSHP